MYKQIATPIFYCLFTHETGDKYWTNWIKSVI